jgi:hypothetical protein
MKEVVLFYMLGCPFCDAMMPEWRKFRLKHPRIRAHAVERQLIPPGMPVTTFPTVALVDDGRIVKVHHGARKAASFARFASSGARRRSRRALKR